MSHVLNSEISSTQETSTNIEQNSIQNELTQKNIIMENNSNL